QRATATEELIGLDGETRLLTDENIVITNGNRPVGLAGVMGGANSEISQETTTVALEASVFNPLSIRKSLKQFNLRSVSSSR
ncbi:phenylalanine--tRNA ligase beta subunit-related protein, partial [Enterococcus faecalis]|uniref:phenylalanine--tRNA ligase beta subunit-related protein n=1 Tax=Enterococcus faecalis TaxID=1351 RepID=UPI003D6ACE6C